MERKLIHKNEADSIHWWGLRKMRIQVSHLEIFNEDTRDMLYFSNGDRNCRIFGYYKEHDYFFM